MPDVETVRVKKLVEQLTSLPLFKSAQFGLESVANDEVYLLTYNFGDKVIANVDKEREAIVAIEKMPLLKSNPLFIVLDGFAEIHRPAEMPEGEPIPWKIIEAGDCFGEFEIEGICDESHRETWNPYVAQVTAGIATAYVSSNRFGKPLVQYAMGGDASKHLDLGSASTVAQVLHNTFSVAGLQFSLILLVIPRPVLQKLCQDAKFLKPFFAAFERHFRHYRLLNPVLSNEKVRKKDSTHLHFVNSLIHAIIRGDLPFLAPCTEYPVLAKWWNWYHSKLLSSAPHKVNSLYLPHYLFVPVSGKRAKTLAEGAGKNSVLHPILSGLMIQGLFHGTDVYTDQPGQKFIDQVNQCISMTGQNWYFSKLLEGHIVERRKTDWPKISQNPWNPTKPPTAKKKRKSRSKRKSFDLPGGNLYYIELRE